MSSSFLEKVYDFIKDNSSSTTTTTTETGTSTTTSSGSKSSTTFTTTVNEAAVIPIMKFTDGQINTFEGRISATYLFDSNTYDVEVYIKLVACGGSIIEPIFCTTTAFPSDVIANLSIFIRRITHNEDGSVMIAIQPLSDSIIYIQSFTVEGTTNSPPDYDTLSSDDYTESSITDSYYSTFSYPTGTSSDIKYLRINISEAGLSSNNL